MAQLEDGITFVTAYFDLGTFQKGIILTDLSYGKHTYIDWMTAFSKFNNSVILFTDSSDVATLFQILRKQFPSHMTRIINIQQDSLWSFKLAPQIKQIYAQLGYPYYSPNTINEKYSCAMHVKYEALEMVIRQKQYKTKHLAWIDIGYFRDKETKTFTLEIPPDLKKDHIAFMQNKKFEKGLLPLDIIGDNMVWLAGGMFLGQPDYLLTFIADYRRTVESLIADNLMSTDQQVLYIMYSKNTKVRARVPIQVYYHICRCDWFFLGSICRYTWEKKHWHRPPVGYFGALAL
ncbi:Protein HtrL [Mizuhopecten yessoensis]|uniref:Protein HtrL n=2 Tax=Mizuhopecten yessoensis TaxID=6573 RepID=A0A210R2N7_MIZYE|nr:Protein HtrL [Mizuhopecten yessoensis]